MRFPFPSLAVLASLHLFNQAVATSQNILSQSNTPLGVPNRSLAQAQAKRRFRTPLLATLSLCFSLFIPPVLAQTCDSNIAPNNPTSEFTLHGDGTVSHSDTGLMWDRCAWGQTGANCESGTAGEYTWNEAHQQADLANQQAYRTHLISIMLKF